MEEWCVVSDINVEFKKYWMEKYPQYPIWPEDPTKEFRPQRELYDNSKTDLKYKEWLKDNDLSDYRSDMALRDYPLLVECDGGSGFSHNSSKGVQRDRDKVNQNLKLGYITLRFSVSELKASFDFVADEIIEIMKVWFDDV